VKRTIVVLSVIVLAFSLTAFAASKNGSFTSPDGRITFMPARGINHGSPTAQSKDPVIFNELATKDPNVLYWCCEGWTVSGPNSAIGEEIWYAQAFTPAANSHAKKLTFQISYIEGTYTDVVLAIYADCSGVPCATPLKHWTVTLDTETFGMCCAVETHSAGNLALTGGTQYWVAATTEAASDIWAAWNMGVYDQVDSTNQADYVSGTWGAFSYNLSAAVEVTGTVP